jgi:hypothetical protein
MVGRVGYSEPRLATQAQAIARDASDYLSRNYGRRMPLAPLERPRIVGGTLIVALYDNTSR